MKLSHEGFPVLAVAIAIGLAFLAGRWTAQPHDRPAARRQSTVVVQPASAAGAAGAPAAETTTAGWHRLAALVPSSIAGEEQRERAIERWAEADPQAALRFVRRQLKGDRQAQALSAVLSNWGRRDPAAAWNWVEKEMPSATHHFDTLLEVFGRESTATAAEYAARFASQHPEATLEVHLAALLGITYRGDFAGARSLVEGNASLAADVRATLDNFIAGQWARFAPADAVAWVQSLPAGGERDQAMIGLGESWSDVDPAAAASFAAELPDGGPRTLALRQAIAKWVATDAPAARAWVIATDRHEDFDQAVQAIATDTNLVNRQPDRAMRWAATIFDDGVRAQAIGTILHNWYPMDPAGATAYIEQSPEFTPDQRVQMIEKLRAAHPPG